jgi:DNA-binding transcriptional ArsR family regulator
MAPALLAPATDIRPAAADFLRLLADPTRRQIFLLIMRGESCNCELADELGVPQNLVSHHLRKLREGGLVREHRDRHDGRWVHFTVDPAGLTTAWDAVRAAFDPARLGSRTPARYPRAERQGQE